MKANSLEGLIADPALSGLQTSIRVDPVIEEMEALEDFTFRILGPDRIPPLQYQKIEISVDEIFSNIVQYSCASFAEIVCEADSKDIRIIFTDDGIPFDPLMIEEQPIMEVTPTGGQGIRIVKELMDRVDYCRKSNMNILTITLKIQEDDENGSNKNS